MKAIILAGGKGTRLRPYTTVFPKPLMPIGNKPILEIIIGQLQAYGITDITLAVGYLSELILAFFNNGAKLGVNIKYSKEDKPLGTAGVLGLLKEELKDTFLMMNGDVLTNIDYSKLISYHMQSKAIVTIALNIRQVYIDFGIVDFDNKTGDIKEYIEKPTLEKFVSMGIYIFQPEVLNYIIPNEYLDFPQLIKILLANGKSIRGYFFDGYWLDIGRTDDYEKANNESDEILRKIKISS